MKPLDGVPLNELRGWDLVVAEDALPGCLIRVLFNSLKFSTKTA